MESTLEGQQKHTPRSVSAGQSQSSYSFQPVLTIMFASVFKQMLCNVQIIHAYLGIHTP